MSKRFTITEKWEDTWFSGLNPIEKLVWNYLCDKCDLAGFWEINVKLAAFQIGITKTRFLGALQGVGRGYITNDKYLWLRRFIEHQGNLPLNPKNNAHKHILTLLERHTDFGDVDFFKEIETTKTPPFEPLNRGLSKGISNGKGNGKGKKQFFDFVFLSKEEHSKLVAKFGESRTAGLIEELNTGIGSKGYKYKSHYFTILNWARRKDKENPPEPRRGETPKENRKRVREDYEAYLRAKTTPALKDLRKDKGQISIAHWLIDEILKER